MADARPSLTAALEAFGLPAVVTVPGGSPVETTAFWLPPTTEETPAGGEFRRAETQRVLVISSSDVPDLVRETLIEIAEIEDGDEKTWKVDAMDRYDSDHWRVVVVEVDGGT